MREQKKRTDFNDWFFNDHSISPQVDPLPSNPCHHQQFLVKAESTDDECNDYEALRDG
jgi:hypothetical protein